MGAVAAVGCSESPFEPRGEGERVPIGQVIQGGVTSDTARRYSFEVRSGAEYAVFLEAQRGTISLAVLDSIDHRFIDHVVAGPDSPPFDENASGGFTAPEAAVYVVRVTTPSSNAARFRFRVYQIDPAPETRPARFRIGDTVSGETIDPLVDADEFVVAGEAGQEVVAAADAQGPAGSGAVSLTVTDPSARDLLAYVFASAGTSTPLTTGRFRLPTSQDYRFIFRSVLSYGSPRYRGPYRFWSYAIDRAPEHRPPALPVGVEVGGERIDRAGDVDEFTFQAAAGAEFNAFLQSSRSFQVEVAPAAGPVLASGTSVGSDTGLFAHATGRFQIPAAGSYVVRVSGVDSHVRSDTGVYRLFLYPVDRRPERVPAAITPGDTLDGEAIDIPGDVDEFTFSGTAGEEFNAFLQARSGSPDTYLQLEVWAAGGTRLGGVTSSGTDTTLLRQSTGRFALPTTGTYRLRVSGMVDRTDRDRGSYRVLLYKVNRRPETAPDTIALGDSVSRESIDVPGDVDEWRVTVPDSTGANLVVQRGPDDPDGVLTAQLLDATGRPLASAYSFGPGSGAASAGQTGLLALAPGTYTVRVEGASLLAGTYRLWLYAFKFGPESVRDTIVLGDTVAGESIDPPGDVDTFRFFGRQGDHVIVALQALVAPLGAFVSNPGGFPLAVFGSWPEGDSLGRYQSNRLDLPADAWYRVSVSGASSPPLLSERGPYRLAVIRQGTAPEHVMDALAPGDSVTSEAVDFPGDWDEYKLTATPGKLLHVVVQALFGAGGPRVDVLDSTGQSIAWAMVLSSERSTAPFSVPASGRLRIALFEPRSGCCWTPPFTFVGAYRLAVVPFNPGPENVPATFVLGDTVRGEEIRPTGDVDEFTSTGTPGDTLTAGFRLVDDAVPTGAPITLEVVDPATRAVLTYAYTPYVQPGGAFVTGIPVAVPPSGTYVIRLRGLYDIGTARYEFFVKPRP